MLVRILCLVVFLIRVAFLTLLERKVLGLVGLRFGPNKVSILGRLQALGDACKLINKQINILSSFRFSFYYLRSCFILICAMYLWGTFLRDPSLLEIKLSLLAIILILSFNSLNSIIAGWRTFSKYSLIGRIRTVSQLISYESILYLCLLFFCYLLRSFCLRELLFLPPSFLGIFLPIVFFLWIPRILAELNRTPFDFSEGERELVRGFNTEFGSRRFTLIFLAEYSNILFLSFLSAFIFLFSFRGMRIYLFLLGIIWIRSVCPRFRFDKLMNLAWKFLLPYLTIVFICYILFFF